MCVKNLYNQYHRIAHKSMTEMEDLAEGSTRNAAGSTVAMASGPHLEQYAFN